MCKVSPTASFLRSLFYPNPQRSNSTQRTARSFLRACLVLAAVLGLLAGGQTAVAATLSWDPGITAGGTLGGTGFWATGTANWWNNTADQAWVNLTRPTRLPLAGLPVR